MGERWSRWWDRWEPVVAVSVVAVIVVGVGLVVTGVVSFDDRARAEPAQAEPAQPVAVGRTSAAPERPTVTAPAWPPTVVAPDRPPTDSRATSVPASASPEPLAVGPGGPAAGAPAADRVVHAFGSVPVGSTSRPLVLAVTNSLAHPVEVRSVATRSAAFTIRDDTCTTAVLQPRTTCRLTVVFAPASAGDAQSPVAVRLRQVCTGSAHWPCDAGEAQIRVGVPDGARTVLPSGQVAVDWTTNLNDGWSDLWVEGTTG